MAQTSHRIGVVTPWRQADQRQFCRRNALRPHQFLAMATIVLCLAGLPASAQTLDELKRDGENADNVLTYGMGYSLQRFSPLTQINKTTIKRLVPIWSLSLANEWGEQAQP